MDFFVDKNISPMLLEEQKEPFDDENYIFELKLDGIREEASSQSCFQQCWR